MSKERELDVVVFGATGFTGYYILLELMRTSPQSGMGSKIGAAGRTLAKLEKVVSRAVHELSQEGIIFRAGAVELIKADVNDDDSLLEMSKRTKLVINAVGPYRKYGLPMVKACISAGTHHLDICGEPEFIEKVDLLYGGEDGLAAANKCYVVSAVGFDSVPCDLGVVHNQRVSEKKGLVPSSVESFLTVRTTGKNGFAAHYATWECLVLGFHHAGNLRKIRKELQERHAMAADSAPAAKPLGPKPKRSKGPTWDGRVKAYALPFLGSDASVVRRTQASLGKSGAAQPVHHSALFTVSSRYALTLFAIFGATMSTLIKFKLGRWLLLRFPRVFTFGVFSHQGPTETQIYETFFDFLFIGKSYSTKALAEAGGGPDVEVRTTLSGPEPGYLACSTFVVQAAFRILQDKLSCPHGVRTTGEVFGRDDQYINRLTKVARGTSREISVKTL